MEEDSDVRMEETNVEYEATYEEEHEHMLTNLPDETLRLIVSRLLNDDLESLEPKDLNAFFLTTHTNYKNDELRTRMSRIVTAFKEASYSVSFLMPKYSDRLRLITSAYALASECMNGRITMDVDVLTKLGTNMTRIRYGSSNFGVHFFWMDGSIRAQLTLTFSYKLKYETRRQTEKVIQDPKTFNPRLVYSSKSVTKSEPVVFFNDAGLSYAHDSPRYNLVDLKSSRFNDILDVVLRHQINEENIGLFNPGGNVRRIMTPVIYDVRNSDVFRTRRIGESDYNMVNIPLHSITYPKPNLITNVVSLKRLNENESIYKDKPLDRHLRSTLPINQILDAIVYGKAVSKDITVMEILDPSIEDVTNMMIDPLVERWPWNIDMVFIQHGFTNATNIAPNTDIQDRVQKHVFVCKMILK